MFPGLELTGTEIIIDPRLLWVVGVITGLIVILRLANSGSQEIDKLAHYIQDSTKKVRNARQAALEKEVEWCKNRIMELIDNIYERDRLVEEHSRWDHKMIMTLIRMDPNLELEDPPTLVPESRITFIEPPSVGKDKENASS